MIRRFPAILMALFFSLSCLAQKPVAPNSISISTGVGIPTGAFAKTDIFTSNAGFAKPGPHFTLLYEHAIHSNWHLLFQAHVLVNGSNTKAYEKGYNEALFSTTLSFTPSTGGPAQPGYSRYPNWNIDGDSWSALALQAGAQYEYPLSTKTSLYARLLAGSVYVTPPGLEGASITDTATCAMYFSPGDGWGLSYTVGAGINRQLGQKLFLTAGLSYLGTGNTVIKESRAELRATQGVPGEPDYRVFESVSRGTYKAKLATLNIMVGVGIKF